MKSWVAEVDDEEGVFQKEGIDSIMLLYLFHLTSIETTRLYVNYHLFEI